MEQQTLSYNNHNRIAQDNYSIDSYLGRSNKFNPSDFMFKPMKTTVNKKIDSIINNKQEAEIHSDLFSENGKILSPQNTSSSNRSIHSDISSYAPTITSKNHSAESRGTTPRAWGVFNMNNIDSINYAKQSTSNSSSTSGRSSIRRPMSARVYTSREHNQVCLSNRPATPNIRRRYTLPYTSSNNGLDSHTEGKKGKLLAKEFKEAFKKIDNNVTNDNVAINNKHASELLASNIEIESLSETTEKEEHDEKVNIMPKYNRKSSIPTATVITTITNNEMNSNYQNANNQPD